MPSASSNGSGPRYAPDDPTLPEPWKGLVDGSTGYLYYWNPVTNVTQYEKPVQKKLPGPPPLPPPPAKPTSMSVSSSVHRGESHDEDGRSRNHQYQGSRPSGSHAIQSLGDAGRAHGHGSHVSRTSARAHGPSDASGSLSAEAYRRQHEISILGDDVPPPYITFESTGFPSEILKEVHRAGFTTPTPIQAQSWPIALQSRDVVAIAKTGSGKTLGYLIPGFIHLKRLRNNPKMGPTVLVLAPTRELATQIQDEADKFGRSSKIACTCVYGGAPKGPQLRDIDRGVDVIVATPGRLNDILEMRRVNLRQVSYLVLDEADRMLDMGFEPQIRKIVKEIPHRRQTLMFTATWPKEVRKIAADLLVHPAQVNIGSIDELVANKAITQYVEVIKPIEKQRRLEQILRSQEPGSKVIIFCSTKRMCDQLAKTLTRQFGAAAIHGDKNQSERDRVLGHFRTGRSPILVATDVAARGLDIKDIRVVINYDFPTGVEDYVHRIGRTGRAGATGVSYTFFSDQDSKHARELVKVLEGAGQRVPSELRDMVSHGGYGGRSRRWGSGARDRGRSNGMAHDDSTYGAKGGRGLPPPGRLDADRSIYRSDRDTHDRYDRERGYKERHEGDAKGREDYKPIPRGSIRSRSHSRSLSPRAEARGRADAKSISRGRVRSRSGSQSVSPSPKRARVGRGYSQSRSRSRSGSLGRGRSRSRSNSHHGRSIAASRQSPVPKRREPLVDDHACDRPGHSPAHQSPPKKRELPGDDHPYVRPRRSPAHQSPPKKREIPGDDHPYVRPRRSPAHYSPPKKRELPGDDHSYVRPRRSPAYYSPPKKRELPGDDHSYVRPHRSPAHCSPSKKRELSADHPYVHPGRSQARASPQQQRKLSPASYDDGEIRDGHCPQQHRQLSPAASYDDGEIRDGHFDLSPSLRKERPRSPIQSREDRLERSRSPRKLRPRSPLADENGRDSPDPPRHQMSPNHANIVGGPPIDDDKLVQSRPLASDGDEEEEGMILPDDEEGMIHPDEGIVSAKGK